MIWSFWQISYPFVFIVTWPNEWKKSWGRRCSILSKSSSIESALCAAMVAAALKWLISMSPTTPESVLLISGRKKICYKVPCHPMFRGAPWNAKGQFLFQIRLITCILLGYLLLFVAIFSINYKVLNLCHIHSINGSSVCMGQIRKCWISVGQQKHVFLHKTKDAFCH